LQGEGEYQKNMKLTISDTAKLLAIPDATIKRWIQQGKIPVMEDRNGYFFIKEDIEKWALNHNIFLHKHFQKNISENPQSEYSLLKAMKQGGIFFHVRGDSVADVLKETISLSPLPFDVDKDLLLDMLLQREKLASTGIGSGIAIPHPRCPIENLANSAIITTCFTENKIDFKAIDGMPVFVIFLMLSPSTDIHLRFLSRLSYCLRDNSFISLLKQNTEPKYFFNKVEQIEKSFDG